MNAIQADAGNGVLFIMGFLSSANSHCPENSASCQYEVLRVFCRRFEWSSLSCIAKIAYTNPRVNMLKMK
jgi:hypothetical protein